MSYVDQVKTAELISRKMANSSGVSYEDLLFEATDKIPTINKNFIPQLKGDFLSYLKNSLRGYLKNYIRDKSFGVRIPRRILDIYMKTKKYSSVYIASLHTRWSEKQIQEAHDKVREHRPYNTGQIQPWSVEFNSLSSTNEFVEAKQLCDEADIDRQLMFDYYVDKLEDTFLLGKHGKDWFIRITDQTNKLKLLARKQGYETNSLV